jgi:chromosome segregation ATPase
MTKKINKKMLIGSVFGSSVAGMNIDASTNLPNFQTIDQNTQVFLAQQTAQKNKDQTVYQTTQKVIEQLARQAQIQTGLLLSSNQKLALLQSSLQSNQAGTDSNNKKLVGLANTYNTLEKQLTDLLSSITAKQSDLDKTQSDLQSSVKLQADIDSKIKMYAQQTAANNSSNAAVQKSTRSDAADIEQDTSEVKAAQAQIVSLTQLEKDTQSDILTLTTAISSTNSSITTIQSRQKDLTDLMAKSKVVTASISALDFPRQQQQESNAAVQKKINDFGVAISKENANKGSLSVMLSGLQTQLVSKQANAKEVLDLETNIQQLTTQMNTLDLQIADKQKASSALNVFIKNGQGAVKMATQTQAALNAALTQNTAEVSRLSALILPLQNSIKQATILEAAISSIANGLNPAQKALNDAVNRRQILIASISQKQKEMVLANNNLENAKQRSRIESVRYQYQIAHILQELNMLSKQINGEDATISLLTPKVNNLKGALNARIAQRLHIANKPTATMKQELLSIQNNLSVTQRAVIQNGLDIRNEIISLDAAKKNLVSLNSQQDSLASSIADLSGKKEAFAKQLVAVNAKRLAIPGTKESINADIESIQQKIMITSRQMNTSTQMLGTLVQQAKATNALLVGGKNRLSQIETSRQTFIASQNVLDGQITGLKIKSKDDASQLTILQKKVSDSSDLLGKKKSLLASIPQSIQKIKTLIAAISAKQEISQKALSGDQKWSATMSANIKSLNTLIASAQQSASKEAGNTQKLEALTTSKKNQLSILQKQQLALKDQLAQIVLQEAALNKLIQSSQVQNKTLLSQRSLEQKNNADLVGTIDSLQKQIAAQKLFSSKELAAILSFNSTITKGYSDLAAYQEMEKEIALDGSRIQTLTEQQSQLEETVRSYQDAVVAAQKLIKDNRAEIAKIASDKALFLAPFHNDRMKALDATGDQSSQRKVTELQNKVMQDKSQILAMNEKTAKLQAAILNAYTVIRQKESDIANAEKAKRTVISSLQEYIKKKANEEKALSEKRLSGENFLKG